jgi:Fe-S cluster biogenesis protein NfuA
MAPLSHRDSKQDGAIEARINEALAALRPILHIETLGIELVRFSRETGVAELRFQGDCPDCDLSASMLQQGVEAHLRTQVPEVRSIRAI